MSKEAMKLALEALEKLNNTNSHWWQEVDENVIVQLSNAESALREALAEQQAQQEPVTCRYGDNGYACCEGGPCAAEEHNDKTDWQERGMVAEAALAKLLDEKQKPVAIVASHLERVDWLRDEPPDGTLLYTSPPAQQEPVAWRNAALRVGEDLCSVGPFGYYDMTAEQWLDWALSVVTVHAPPPQRKPLTITEESAWDLARYVYARANPHESPQILLSAREIKQIIEAAHGIKEQP
jgi:hypothetical protein